MSHRSRRYEERSRRRRSTSRHSFTRSPRRSTSRRRRREVSRERRRDSRDRDRDRDLRDFREREREREPREHRERRSREKVQGRERPSATLQVSGIPASVTEERLEAVAWEKAVAAGSSMPNAVKFEYEGHHFEGTALVEFPHKEAAQMFKEHTGNSLDVDGVSLNLRYKKLPGEVSRSRSRERIDRDEPSVTLIVKGIMPSTREDTLKAAFQAYAPVKDIRHFSRRGFAFVQFHSVEEAVRALNGFDKSSNSRVDGIKVQANFAKEREEPIREGRPFMLAERSFLQKQAIATAEVTAEIEKLQQQQIQHENTSKALSGVNGSMWANYMQSVAQTETVQSSNSFKFDKDSGFYKDVKAQLYYDPNSTYFFTLDYKKYFVYDSEVQLLCLVDSQGKKVPGGETRPLPSQVTKSGSRPEKLPERERPRSRSRRPRSRSDVRDRRDRRRESEAKERDEREGHGKPQSTAKSAARTSDFHVEEIRHQPIHFPGGDPLAKLANAQPLDTSRTPQPKKKKKAPEGVLGLAASAPLQRPGPVTVFAARPVTQASPPSPPPSAAAFVPPVPSSPSMTSATTPALDWICEVCMRKFSSEEALRKHEQLSELHKQNLMKLGV